jgi:outer membrane murein-binding lipoprotein Lpp
VDDLQQQVDRLEAEVEALRSEKLRPENPGAERR